MSRYGQYNYYDPVGSSQPQPTGYTYQSTSNAPSYPSAAASSGYGADQPSYGNSGYGAQSYGTNAQQGSSATTHAAAALSSLGNQDYNQASNRTGQYDSSQWYGSNNNASYGSSNPQPPNRSQANTSPLYAGTQGSSFGRLNVPDQAQNTSSAYGSAPTYQNAPSSAGTNYRYQSNTSQAVQNPPQSYNSPLHAVQAQQQSHQKQSSRGSNHQQASPRMANAARYAQQNRQASASVEPSPTTVDPSQVYDNRAELERKARYDAERRKKIEAEQAAKKAEEDRIASERQKAEEAGRKAAEAAEAAKKEQQDRKNEQRRKAREEKRQSKSAATTLQQMASMGTDGSAAGDDEESEMRAMFKKMREFNSKNPAMLAKLWEEERKQHSESQSPQAEKATPTPAAKTAHARQPSGTPSQMQQRSAPQPSKVPPKQSPAQQTKTPTPAVSQASPITTSSRPAVSSASNSLWPPHKKGALADATAKWLMGLPENAGKTISQQAVLNILNTNPSYVQLCESLENLDMKFERSTLARELLKAVPDGLRTPSQSQPKSSAPTATVIGAGAPTTAGRGANHHHQSTSQPSASRPHGPSESGTVSYDAPLSLSDAAREVNGMHKSAQQGYGVAPQLAQQSPYLSQSQTLMNGSRPPLQARAPSQSQPPEVKPEVKAEEPARPPANKEEAARKRTFGDLVDLTKDDDSDDDGPPPKKMFSAPGILPSNDERPQFRDPLGYLQRQPAPQPPFKPYSYQPRNVVPGTGVMQPSQQAQPILPSTQQQQPTQAPVPPKPKGPSAEQLQQSRMRGRMLVEPIMRDRVARRSRYDSSTIARDVLLATGRHPDMRGLNSHLNNMQKLLGHHGGEVDTAGTRCDLSTIRWDILDPEQPKESAEKEDHSQEAATDTAPTPMDQPAPPAAPMSTTVDYEAPFSSGQVLSGPPLKEKKKRGRKPHVSMPDSGLGERASPNTPARPATTNNTPNHDIDPALLAHANDMAARGTPVGYSAFRQIGPDGQVIKKKGRPVGWRKNVHSREAQGLPAYPKPPKDLSKLGRPSKGAKEKAIVQPQWQSYHCEWQGCKAELLNLDTLKKHLVKVHGREVDGGRGYQCVWRDCDRQPGEGGGFSDLEQWFSHVDHEHLQPIAWKQGDGPTGGSLGESPSYRRSATPSYLNDAHGRSVTPVISEPTPPPQVQTAAQSAQATFIAEVPKRIGRPPKDGIPRLERDAGAELKKLEEHKAVVGPTMDRQGCVLVSEERRRTFLGDEDFEDEVDASEDEGIGLWG